MTPDNESFRDTAAMEFRLKNWEVETASDGAEALDRLREDPERFDAILLDRKMPHLSGDAVLDHLYRLLLLADICVIVLTGHFDSESDDAVNAVARGAWHYLLKPKSVDEIIAYLSPGIAYNKCHQMRHGIFASSVDQVLNEIGSVISETLKADSCYLSYVSDRIIHNLRTGKQTEAKHNHRFITDIVAGKKFIYSNTPVGTLTMEPVNLDSISLMAVPVILGQSKPIGVLSVESTKEHVLQEHWQKVLLYMSDLISFARLAEAQRQESDRTRLTNREFQHRLATSVSIIGHRAQILIDHAPGNRDVHVIKRHIGYIDSVMNELLDLREIDIKLVPDQDVVNLVGRAMADLEPEATAAGIKLIRPPAGESIPITLDPEWMAAVFSLFD